MSSEQHPRIKDEQEENERRMERPSQNRSLPSMINTSQRGSYLPSQGYNPHSSPTYTSSPDMYPHSGIAAQADAYHDTYASPSHQYPAYGQTFPSFQYPTSSSYLPPMQDSSQRFRQPREPEPSLGYGEPSYPHIHGSYPEAGYDYGRSLPRSLSHHERTSKVPKRRTTKPKYGFNPKNAILIGCFADWQDDGSPSYHEQEEQMPISKPPKAEKKFLCPHRGCDRATPGNGFTTPNDLERHRRSVHKEAGTYFQCRDLACSDNGKFFARRDNFVDHMRRMHKFGDMSKEEIDARLTRLAREWISKKADDGTWTHEGTDIIPNFHQR